MKVILYKTVSEKNRITKVLTDEVTLNGALRDASSVVSPSILVQQEVIGYNYAYIPEFGRHYFINNITSTMYKNTI